MPRICADRAAIVLSLAWVVLPCLSLCLGLPVASAGQDTHPHGDVGGETVGQGVASAFDGNGRWSIRRERRMESRKTFEIGNRANTIIRLSWPQS